MAARARPAGSSKVLDCWSFAWSLSDGHNVGYGRVARGGLRLVEPSREREMLALRAEGYSLAAIGRRFGVSRQRVDQIVRRAGGAGVGREASRARRAQEVRARRALHTCLARERSAEILERYREGADAHVIARELGFQDEVVRGLICRWRTDADRVARATALQRAGSPRYSEAELRRAVRIVVERVGRAPTCEEYDRAARELGLASGPTACMRFGGWHNALRAAGVEPSGADPIRTPRWHVAACWRAVVPVADLLGDPPRYRAYATLAAGRDDLPSGPTVRQRLGLWSDIAGVLIEQRANDLQRPVTRVPAARVNGYESRENPPSPDRTSSAMRDGSFARLPSRLEARALEYLAQHPGSSGRAVGRGLEIRRDSQAWTLLDRLERDGLLAKHRDGSNNAWTLTKRGAAVLEQLPQGIYASARCAPRPSSNHTQPVTKEPRP